MTVISLIVLLWSCDVFKKHLRKVKQATVHVKGDSIRRYLTKHTRSSTSRTSDFLSNPLLYCMHCGHESSRSVDHYKYSLRPERLKHSLNFQEAADKKYWRLKNKSALGSMEKAEPAGRWEGSAVRLKPVSNAKCPFRPTAAVLSVKRRWRCDTKFSHEKEKESTQSLIWI